MPTSSSTMIGETPSLEDVTTALRSGKTLEPAIDACLRVIAHLAGAATVSVFLDEGGTRLRLLSCSFEDSSIDKRNDIDRLESAIRRLPLVCGRRKLGEIEIESGTAESCVDVSDDTIAAPVALLSTLISASICSADMEPGILSASAIRAQTKIEAERACRHTRPLSILRIQIVVDARSSGSDTELAELVHNVGRHLTSLLRRGDVVGTSGHSELTVLLPDTCPLGARVAARRILDTLRDRNSAGGIICSWDCRVETIPHEHSEPSDRIANPSLAEVVS